MQSKYTVWLRLKLQFVVIIMMRPEQDPFLSAFKSTTYKKKVIYLPPAFSHFDFRTF